jgi:hypothetical protein
MMGLHAPVPQLDRGAVYETESCGFKSRRARLIIDASPEGVRMEQARVATPVDWLYAPEWLTPLEASYLSGHTVDFIN